MCRIIATYEKYEYPKISPRITRFRCKLQGLVNAEGDNINSPSYDHQTTCHFLVDRIQIYSFLKYQKISLNLALQWRHNERDGDCYSDTISSFKWRTLILWKKCHYFDKTKLSECVICTTGGTANEKNYVTGFEDCVPAYQIRILDAQSCIDLS